MKTITLKEFAEIVKKDDVLKEKMLKIAAMKTDDQTDAMIALAAEYGYELEKETPLNNLEEMSDDDLENVAGGIFFGNLFCAALIYIFQMDPNEKCDPNKEKIDYSL